MAQAKTNKQKLYSANQIKVQKIITFWEINIGV